jgi:NosR/NirI family transcriptional regulator, nitrous oxide reductase regulator
MNVFSRFARWIHTGFPAGTSERLPEVASDFTTNVPGLFVVGDLTGVPLLKFAADGGARVVRRIAAEKDGREIDAAVDVAIVGGGVAGMAAALEARRLGLRFEVFEAREPFATIADFPTAKPIFTYPVALEPQGELRFTARSAVKEGLLAELQDQARDVPVTRARVERVVRRDGAFDVFIADKPTARARHVIVAIGRSGDFRKLDVPGEELPKVHHRIHDPADERGRRVAVVGGGDSACEAAVAFVEAGAQVTLVHRGTELARPKPENADRVASLVAAGRLDLRLGARITAIHPHAVELRGTRGSESLPNDVVYSMIGRVAPLDFFRASGVAIRGEWRLRSYLSLAAIVLFAALLYNWKAGADVTTWFRERGSFPFNLESRYAEANRESPAAFATILLRAAREPGFWYSLAYCVVMIVFGARRIRRRRTPYVRAQTLALIAIQVIPLFVLPYFLLPWFDRLGAFDAGAGRAFADALFPAPAWGGEREYWRAFGIVLAWPLFFWNVFTDQPTTTWLVISFIQTFVLIPLLVWRFGKGAYCGWICSCGGLAETLGDAHREKMPHGPIWNRLNLLGQFLLAVCFALLALRIGGWIAPGSWSERTYRALLTDFAPFGIQLNYRWTVDVLLAGILGIGLYFHFSGRTWCRFACPLAALMHIYARFSRFRIFADKKKCISCGLCTAVCHQGIDVMAFANKGKAMDDPQCVRCSACVSTCPTHTLGFGRLDPATGTAHYDELRATRNE